MNNKYINLNIDLAQAAIRRVNQELKELSMTNQERRQIKERLQELFNELEVSSDRLSFILRPSPIGKKG